ncbi:hypothetical protein NDU88_002349 [Pleurodeles waltl]|uniref:VWFD domain-containing protein n=1 Tax=Pleurodeles waltl TaxID=8319 RepID=A0AAV7TLQ6_PLEWA|nr:hypothetical protein NDU88_002349 [Pleurodeles waltl]
MALCRTKEASCLLDLLNSKVYDDGDVLRRLTDDIALFGNSWKEKDPKDMFEWEAPFHYEPPCLMQSKMFLQSVYTLCNTLLSHPFEQCHDYVSPFPFMASCTSDLCMSGNDDQTWCRALTEYARACAQAGSPLHWWRRQVQQCAIECENDLIYNECINCCPVSCQQKKQCVDSELPCVDGCYCEEGLIYENGVCVTPSECPCDFHGDSYKSGSVVRDDCNNCTCVGGKWICTDLICPVECSVTGDIHFMTFDGRKYTFQASCQYILAKSLTSGKFTVTLQNVPCGQNQDGSCIQSVSLILNQDARKQVTLTHLGDVLVYDHYKVNLPYSDDLFEIRQLSSVFMQVKTQTGLQIQYDREGLRIYLRVDGHWKDDTVGLCGTFNGNIQDDFLSPVGVPESTPELFGNAWKTSSVCSPDHFPSPLDPCDVHLQSVSYATEGCSIITKELFAPCHSYVSPVSYYEQCRRDTCKCGQTCLCSALAHYAHQCRRYGVVVDFRSQVTDCALSCENSKEYSTCVDTCAQTCQTLSVSETCNGDCVEGCACRPGMYLNSKSDQCVERNECPCYFQGIDYPPGESIITSLGKCSCKGGIMNCEISDFVYDCPAGQIYINCSDPGVNTELSRERTCENHLLNLTLSAHAPCVSGCVCPPGFVKHGDECFEPNACPCSWKAKEYFPGDIVNSSCHTCVCHHGSFQCTFHPCPSMCTVYGDRHYRTFDGLAFDFIGACKVHLVKSTSYHRFSVTVENVNCFNTGIICRKYISINVGESVIKFEDDTGRPSPSSIIDMRQNIHIWQAGFFTFIHFSIEHITILWDQRTTVHIQVGPQWQNKLTGLCGNFDFKTVNEMKTPENFELTNSQEFGNSWAAVECVDSADIRNPCSMNPLREPFAKKECGILFSEVFEACHPVVDVTWFYSNCLTDTCGCNRGGDCECFCTSVSAYAHQCCQHGIPIDWRSPRVCPYDCEYFNKVLGKGPYKLVNYMDRQLVIAPYQPGSNLFQVKAEDFVQGKGVSFMLTPGLYKPKAHDLTLVSFEVADRPNFFLHVGLDSQLAISKWQKSEDFQNRSTFIIHKNTWIARYKSFESFYKLGYFVRISASSVYLAKYRHSDAFRLSTLFKFVDAKFKYSSYSTCEWRYEACAAACFKTCRDPLGETCQAVPKVEGCIPFCRLNMVLDEVTGRCVYFEDCIEPAASTTPSSSTVPTPTFSNITSTFPYASVMAMLSPSAVSKVESKVLTTTVTMGPVSYKNISTPSTASASSTAPLPTSQKGLISSPSVTQIQLLVSPFPTTTLITNLTTAKTTTVVQPVTTEVAHSKTRATLAKLQTTTASFVHTTLGISTAVPSVTATGVTQLVTTLKPPIKTAAITSTELLKTASTRDLIQVTPTTATTVTREIVPVTETPVTTKGEASISTTQAPLLTTTVPLIPRTEFLTTITTGFVYPEQSSVLSSTAKTSLIFTGKKIESEASTKESLTQKSVSLSMGTDSYRETTNRSEAVEGKTITYGSTTNASTAVLSPLATEVFAPKSTEPQAPSETTKAVAVSTKSETPLVIVPSTAKTLTLLETTSTAKHTIPGDHTVTSAPMISHTEAASTQAALQTEIVKSPPILITGPGVTSKKEVIAPATTSMLPLSPSSLETTISPFAVFTRAVSTEQTRDVSSEKIGKTTVTSPASRVSEEQEEPSETSSVPELLPATNVTKATTSYIELLVSSRGATVPPFATPLPLSTSEAAVPLEVSEKHTYITSTISPALHTSIEFPKSTQTSIVTTQETSALPTGAISRPTSVVTFLTKTKEPLQPLLTTSSYEENILNITKPTIVPFTLSSVEPETSQKPAIKMDTSSYSTYPDFTMFVSTLKIPQTLVTTALVPQFSHTTHVAPTEATTLLSDTPTTSTSIVVQSPFHFVTSSFPRETALHLLSTTTINGTVEQKTVQAITTPFSSIPVSDISGTTPEPYSELIRPLEAITESAQEKSSTLAISASSHSTKTSTTKSTLLKSTTAAPIPTTSQVLTIQEIPTALTTRTHIDTTTAVSYTVAKQEFKNLTGIIKPTLPTIPKSSSTVNLTFLSVTAVITPTQVSLAEQTAPQTTITTATTFSPKVLTISSTATVTPGKISTAAYQTTAYTTPTAYYFADTSKSTQATSEFSYVYQNVTTTLPTTAYPSTPPATPLTSAHPSLRETTIPLIETRSVTLSPVPSTLSNFTADTEVGALSSLPSSTKPDIAPTAELPREVTAELTSEGPAVSILIPTRETATLQSCVPVTENECIKHICVDGQLIQVNKSQNCPYNATQPSCGVLGFAVQINGDKCCPKWECTCK